MSGSGNPMISPQDYMWFRRLVETRMGGFKHELLGVGQAEGGQMVRLFITVKPRSKVLFTPELLGELERQMSERLGGQRVVIQVNPSHPR
jgi:hypothetical protein